VVEVLAPLRLDGLGASGVAIGLIFLVAAAVEAVLSPFLGRLSDRRGRLVPIRLGLLGAMVTGVLVPLPTTSLLLGAAVLLVLTALAGLWTPALAMISDASEGVGLDQGVAFSITNLAWAGGQVIGSAAGGALADASSDYVPYLTMAAICAATFAGIVVLGRRMRMGISTAR